MLRRSLKGCGRWCTLGAGRAVLWRADAHLDPQVCLPLSSPRPTLDARPRRQPRGHLACSSDGQLGQRAARQQRPTGRGAARSARGLASMIAIRYHRSGRPATRAHLHQEELGRAPALRACRVPGAVAVDVARPRPNIQLVTDGDVIIRWTASTYARVTLVALQAPWANAARPFGPTKAAPQECAVAQSRSLIP